MVSFTTYVLQPDGSSLLGTLGTILRDNWEWRDQIARLSLFELVKKSRGAVLSWAWFFIKPGMYIFCFWFALEVGLKAGNTPEGAPPYFLWLCAGLIPWFFMSDMINTGCDVLHRYSYLVTKVKFPMSAISTIFTGAEMIVELMLLVVLFVIYFASGMGLDIYLLQVPLLLVMMFVFWDIFSVLLSQLSAISKDVANLMKALGTPVFWLSGVIFNMNKINNFWVQRIMDLNPVTFFGRAFRDAFYDKTWFWENTSATLGFIGVFILTLIVMIFVYKRFNEEVPDVL